MPLEFRLYIWRHNFGNELAVSGCGNEWKNPKGSMKMKTWPETFKKLALLLAACLSGLAKAPTDVANALQPTVIEKGPHPRTWQVPHVSEAGGRLRTH